MVSEGDIHCGRLSGDHRLIRRVRERFPRHVDALQSSMRSPLPSEWSDTVVIAVQDDTDTEQGDLRRIVALAVGVACAERVSECPN